MEEEVKLLYNKCKSNIFNNNIITYADDNIFNQYYGLLYIDGSYIFFSKYMSLESLSCTLYKYTLYKSNSLLKILGFNYLILYCLEKNKKFIDYLCKKYEEYHILLNKIKKLHNRNISGNFNKISQIISYQGKYTLEKIYRFIFLFNAIHHSNISAFDISRVLLFYKSKNDVVILFMNKYKQYIYIRQRAYAFMNDFVYDYKISKNLSEICEIFNDIKIIKHLCKFVDKIDKLKFRYKKLIKIYKLIELKNADILYRPNGIGYQKTKCEFNLFSNILL